MQVSSTAGCKAKVPVQGRSLTPFVLYTHNGQLLAETAYLIMFYTSLLRICSRQMEQHRRTGSL